MRKFLFVALTLALTAAVAGCASTATRDTSYYPDTSAYPSASPVWSASPPSPDSPQKSVLAALDKERTLRVLTCSTEDEANAIAAGLWMGGEPFALMIQHAGLYASVNTLRGVAMDGRVPIFYMIGLLQREKDKEPRESRHSMVRYCEPLLDLFGVPHARLEGPDDVRFIPEYYRLAQKRRGPAAVLVGLETA